MCATVGLRSICAHRLEQRALAAGLGAALRVERRALRAPRWPSPVAIGLRLAVGELVIASHFAAPMIARSARRMRYPPAWRRATHAAKPRSSIAWCDSVDEQRGRRAPAVAPSRLRRSDDRASVAPRRARSAVTVRPRTTPRNASPARARVALAIGARFGDAPRQHDEASPRDAALDRVRCGRARSARSAVARGALSRSPCRRASPIRRDSRRRQPHRSRRALALRSVATSGRGRAGWSPRRSGGAAAPATGRARAAPARRRAAPGACGRCRATCRPAAARAGWRASASSSAFTGTAISAAPVGVGARMSATKIDQRPVGLVADRRDHRDARMRRPRAPAPRR